MSSRARLLLPVLALVGVLVVPIAAQAWREEPAAGPDPAVAEWPEWPHPVVCGTYPFDPVAAFSSPTGVERTSTPQVRAMKRFLNLGEDRMGRRHDWRILVERPNHVEFGAGRLPDELEVVSVERKRGRWSFSGYSSGCEPASVRRDRAAITWNLVEGARLTPTTRSIRVHLGPSECSSGRPAAPRLQKPEFREQNGALLMSLWLRPLPPGGYTCQGVVEPPLRIKLPEPLGERRFLDGGTYPPRVPRPDFDE